MKVVVSFCASTVLLACGHMSPPAPTASLQDAAARPLGSLDGAPIYVADLEGRMQEKLRDTENESLQRQLHFLWAGFEEAISRRLLERAAQSRGLAADVLWKREVEDKVPPTTDEDAKDFYEENEAMFDVPFEVVAEHIKRELARARRQEQERAFVEELRRAADVTYTLPIPEFPRYPMHTNDAPTLGPESAPITVVEFADYECPYCARAKDILSELQTLYPNKIRLVYRDFPLEQHKNARPAARAAHCAGEQEKFWAYHDLLYQEGSSLESEALRAYAEKLELDAEAFAQCLESSRPDAALDKSLEAARRMGVQGTPAIYINGIKLIGLLPMPLLQALVDHELQKPSK